MKILGYEYEVIRDQAVNDLASMGRCQASSLKIHVASDLAKQQAESTMLHEIIEALNFHLSFDMEHRVIMGIEAALYQCLVDNGVDLSPLLKE